MKTKLIFYLNFAFIRLLLVVLLVFQFGCSEPSGESLQLKYEENESVTYDEAIAYYQKLDKEFKTARLFTYGMTDIGKPLHLFVISNNKDFNPENLRKKNKRIILINNGIHPGEACGIDASLKFADDILKNKNDLLRYLDNTVICIIPIYNIGGALNRNPYHRLNQDGPKECGFRGNAKNLDLNRDFIKNDTENAKSFAMIFHHWKPDVFLDTHTTNGADHKYTITLIATQHNKLHPILGDYLNNEMLPELFRKMEKGPYEMTPYVNSMFRTPDKGIAGFLETGKFSSGYAALFNTFSFMTENHAYKPFRDRVLSVYHFMISLTEFTSENAEKIGELRVKANKEIMTQTEFPLTWAIDTTKFDTIKFKGYKRKYKPSLYSERQTFYYDREDPFEKNIRYYKYFKPVTIVNKPEMYIIPQAWQKVIERLKINDVKMKRLSKDTTITVETYYITDYQTLSRPYNGHFVHSNVQTRSEIQKIKFYKDDYVIPVNQPTNRYIVETLEPKAADSFFSYNFFDSMLARRGFYFLGFFEKKAFELLDENPNLKEKFENLKKEDAEFAENHYAQLRFIYENSPYLEKTYNRYPVFRLNKKEPIPVM